MNAASLCRAGVAAAFGLSGGFALATGLSGALPLRQEAGAVDAGGWMPALVLLALLAVAGGLAVWHRGGGALSAALRRTTRAPHPVPARLASVALTPQASVHVVRWQGEELLLGCTSQQVTVLARKPGAAAAGEEP